MPVRDSAGSLRWLRAIGRRTPSDATDPARNTSTAITAPAPSAAATAAAAAANATGPRKKRPGVNSSPIASNAAITTQTSQATTLMLDQRQ